MLFVGMMLAGSILRREPEFVEVGKTERVPVEKAVTETVTQEVEVTPPECVQALDLASEGFILSAEVMGLARQGFQAIADLDFAAAERIPGELARVSAELSDRSDQGRAAGGRLPGEGLTGSGHKTENAPAAGGGGGVCPTVGPGMRGREPARWAVVGGGLGRLRRQSAGCR